ncbi:PoNe immunity protein domain-containing protein, partial [Parvibium lacunae]
MIRAPMGDQAYWDKWVLHSNGRTKKMLDALALPSKNPMYDPQYAYDASIEYLRLIFERYSRGDAISELGQHFLGLLDAWELSNKLAAELNAQLQPGHGWDHRRLLGAPQVSDDSRSHNDPRSWVFDLTNLNHYNWCFWL